MSKQSYYEECISIAADEMDPPVILTREQIAWLADAVVGAAENYGMYSGEDCIPNPLEAEMDRRGRSHKAEIKAKEDTEERLRATITELRRDVDRLEWKLSEARARC